MFAFPGRRYFAVELEAQRHHVVGYTRVHLTNEPEDEKSLCLGDSVSFDCPPHNLSSNVVDQRIVVCIVRNSERAVYLGEVTKCVFWEMVIGRCHEKFSKVIFNRKCW